MSSLTFSPRVPVIDANICVGNHNTGPSPCQTPTELLAEMDIFGVQRAVIYHAQGEHISPTDGNTMLANWLDKDGRLIPQWAVMPVEVSIKQIEDLYAQGKASSVRLHNTHGNLPFRPWGFDNLLSFLSEVEIPLLIPLVDVDLNDLAITLNSYPTIQTVLIGAHYTHNLAVRNLLLANSNTVLELSRYEPIGAVEDLVDEFGAERFIYGSWYPRYAMGPILFYLHHTRISEEDLALICGGNTERLLGLHRRDND